MKTSIEATFFKKYRPNFDKLIDFGFKKEKDLYSWKQNFFNDQFQAQITVSSNGKISGKVIDNSTDEEYFPLRATVLGAFANSVKDAYLELLQTIAQNCFVSQPFIFPQTNRINSQIIKEFHDHPEFIFKRLPDYAIYREKTSQKWYGLVMNIPADKVPSTHKTNTAEVEVIEFRINPDDREKLLKINGIFSGFHMKNKNWLSIILDETLSDDKIMKLIKTSRELLLSSNNWLVPANPKYYDIMHAFEKTDTIIWKQSTNIQVNDVVYLYVTSPIKAIIYKCRVTEVNIPYQYKSKSLKMTHVMRIKLIKEFPEYKFTFDFLKQHGIKAVRGPRHLSNDLLKFLN